MKSVTRHGLQKIAKKTFKKVKPAQSNDPGCFGVPDDARDPGFEPEVRLLDWLLLPAAWTVRTGPGAAGGPKGSLSLPLDGGLEKIEKNIDSQSFFL